MIATYVRALMSAEAERALRSQSWRRLAGEGGELP
jgi:hypothetical protein